MYKRPYFWGVEDIALYIDRLRSKGIEVDMSIEIKEYTIHDFPLNELICLLDSKYGRNKNYEYFLNDFRTAFDFCASNENILFRSIAVYCDTKMETHIALIKDSRISSNEAFFGFFESSNNQEIFDLLWNALMLLAKKEGINKIKGPINGSIWQTLS